MRWFLLDRSGSVAGGASLPQDPGRGLSRAERWGWGCFAGRSETCAPLRPGEVAPALPAPESLDPGATRLGGVLREALGRTSAGFVPQWIVLTDGRIEDRRTLAPPGGDPRGGDPRGGGVFVVGIDRQPYPDAALLSVSGPPRARGADRAVVRAHVGGHAASEVVVRAEADGVVLVESRLSPLDGGTALTDLSFEVPAGGGDLSVRVSVSIPGDAVPANDALFLRIDREGAVRVAVVTNDPGAGTCALLAGSGVGAVEVVPLHPDAAPRVVEGWALYDAVVLEGVRAVEFPSGALRALSEAISGHGVGLVATGGPEGLGPGGYLGADLERVLPVKLDPAGGSPVALLLVLDKSGTMAEGGRWDLLLAGLDRILSELGPGDRLGVVVFDREAHEAVPPSRVGPGDARRVRERISRFSPGGETAISPAVEAAVRRLVAMPPEFRRAAILVTDGRPEGAISSAEEARRITAAASVSSAAGIRWWGVLTHPLARAEAEVLLGPLCADRLLSCEGPGDLPKRVLEALRAGASGTLVRHGPVRPGRTPEGAWMARGLPEVEFWTRTEARPSAQVCASAGESPADPLVVVGQAGEGRTAAFTGSIDSRWAPAWLAWDGAGAFWRALIERVLPLGGRDGSLSVEEAYDGFRRLHLRLSKNDSLYTYPRDLDLSLQGGEPQYMTPSAPGEWTSDPFPVRGGALAARVLAGDRVVWRGIVPSPYAPEWRSFGPDPEALADLARALGGRVATLDEVFASPPPPRGAQRDLRPACLWVVCLGVLARLALAIRDRHQFM